MDFSRFGNPHVTGQQSLEDTELLWCIVTAVDSEKQTMKVMSGESSTEIEVYINQNITLGGAGIRFIPIPYQTKAIIHSKKGIKTHLGYFLENGETLTESKLGTKESALLLQRYLEPGEVQLMSISQNEIFLEKTGSIYIKSGNNQYIKLNDLDAIFEGEFGSLKFEMDEVRIRSGNVRRPVNTITHEDDCITVVEGNVTKYYKEFTVSVGNIQNTDAIDYQTSLPSSENLQEGQYSVDQYPYDGFMSLASRVFNEQGTEEKVLDKFLKYLLKFPAGISLSVDEEGSLVVLDQSNHNFMRFKVGHNLDENKPLTEFELQINKGNLKVNNNGEMLYTLQNSGDTNKNISVNFKQDSLIEIKNTNDGSTFNDIKMNDTGVTINDFNNNIVTLNGDGTNITDKNNNIIDLTASGTKVTDKNSNVVEMVSSKISIISGGDKIEMGGGKIDITTAAGKITGGQLTVNGTVTPGVTGPFNCLTNCILTNAPHAGTIVTGT